MYPIDTFNLFFGLVLFLVPALLAVWLGFGNQGKILWNSLRSVVQLVGAGIVLRSLFQANQPLLTAGLLAFMLFFAAQIMSRGDTGTRRQRYAGAMLALFLGTALAAVFCQMVIIQAEDFWDPRLLIPLTGMIMAASMKSGLLARHHYEQSLQDHQNLLESLAALGLPPKQVAREFLRRSWETALVPILGAMAAVGVVQLPGMMTGQILAGAPVDDAIKYQIMIMMILLFAPAITSLVYLRYISRKYPPFRPFQE